MDAHKTTPKIKPPKRRLGRGLGSLIGSTAPVEVRPTPKVSIAPTTTPPPMGMDTEAPADPTSKRQPAEGVPTMLAIDVIEPNRNQPRKQFDQEALSRLAGSIRKVGLMQPVVVRPKTGGAGGYELIAGERRWRAAKEAGAQVVPAVIRQSDEQSSAELALIENMHRADLNPMERAQAFDRLAGEFGLTHKAIADLVGIDRTNVTNHLRLLELDPLSQEAVANEELTLGHAKVLLSELDEGRRERLAREAIQENWSVRELERQLASQRGGGDRGQATPKAEQTVKAAHLQDLEQRLGEHLGTRVEIRPGKKKGSGQVMISFFDLDQFEGLLSKMQFNRDA